MGSVFENDDTLMLRARLVPLCGFPAALVLAESSPASPICRIRAILQACLVGQEVHCHSRPMRPDRPEPELSVFSSSVFSQHYIDVQSQNSGGVPETTPRPVRWLYRIVLGCGLQLSPIPVVDLGWTWGHVDLSGLGGLGDR